jgi:hypothetical protein
MGRPDGKALSRRWAGGQRKKAAGVPARGKADRPLSNEKVGPNGPVQFGAAVTSEKNKMDRGTGSKNELSRKHFREYATIVSEAILERRTWAEGFCRDPSRDEGFPSPLTQLRSKGLLFCLLGR